MNEQEPLTNAHILAEIDSLREREWDLLDQIYEARMRRAELMNQVKDSIAEPVLRLVVDESSHPLIGE